MASPGVRGARCCEGSESRTVGASLLVRPWPNSRNCRWCRTRDALQDRLPAFTSARTGRLPPLGLRAADGRQAADGLKPQFLVFSSSRSASAAADPCLVHFRGRCASRATSGVAVGVVESNRFASRGAAGGFPNRCSAIACRCNVGVPCLWATCSRVAGARRRVWASTYTACFLEGGTACSSALIDERLAGSGIGLHQACSATALSRHRTALGETGWRSPLNSSSRAFGLQPERLLDRRAQSAMAALPVTAAQLFQGGGLQYQAPSAPAARRAPIPDEVLERFRSSGRIRARSSSRV